MTDETFEEFRWFGNIENGDYYDEIMEAQNNVFTEKLSGETNIRF
jgi:hypothetical protein